MTDGMRWVRNTRTGGWFQIAEADYKPSSKDRQIQANADEAARLNNEERKQEAGKHADALLSKAHKMEPQVTKDLQEVVQSDNAKLAGLEYRFKGKDSLMDKLERKAVEKGITVEQYSKRVTDVLRYTEMSKENDLYRNFNSFVDKMSARGYTMVECTNTWYDGSVYKGINTLMRTKDGYVFEMQFHTARSLEIKEINHKLYEKGRALGVSQAMKDKYELEMKKNAMSVSTPLNVGKIKSF